jgi:putative tryptophan/tyrosine transport system substrate-binding protein
MSIRIRRREFFVTLGGAAVWPFAARAQPGEQVRRIGVLMGINESDPDAKARIAAFVEGLQQLGWTHGANVLIDYHWAGSDPERNRRYAAQLAGMQPDVVWTTGSLALLALKRATRTIPIVFTSVFDPVGSGFVASLSRPEGNITGFTLGEFSMGGKWLEILKEAAPQITRVAIILNLGQPPHVAMWRVIEAMAPSLKLRLTPADAQDAAEIERVIDTFAHELNGGLIVLPGPVTFNHHELIIALAARHRLPAVYGFRFFATRGGLMSFGADAVVQSQQAADYVNRILKGENPANLPIQQPTKFELAINLKTANALGLTVPPTLLARADEVIE